jgi:hypothetical protein
MRKVNLNDRNFSGLRFVLIFFGMSVYDVGSFGIASRIA